MRTPRASFLLAAVLTLLAAAPTSATPLPMQAGAVRAVVEARDAIATDQPQSQRAGIVRQFRAQDRMPIGPGVTHAWGTMLTGSGQQIANVVEVKPGASGIRIEARLSDDRVVGLETTTTIANERSVDGHFAIAAVNGDVWSSSGAGARAAPFGLHVQGGELMVANGSGRPAFGVLANGRPIIGAPIVSTTLVTPDGARHPIDRINQDRNAGEFVLYTSRFGPLTPSDGSGVDVVLHSLPLPLRPTFNGLAIVADVRPAGSAHRIDPSTVVLNGPASSFLSSMARGQRVRLRISISPGWQTVTQAIGGREFLVRRGSSFIDPRPPLADQHHPRTAIGVTAAGGLILATVDGRDEGYSTGVTDSELAAFMLGSGAVDAINLDGGGSTAMAIRRPGDTYVSIVNRPSDGLERPVPNSLVIYSRVKTGPLRHMTLTPVKPSIYETQGTTFDIIGQDAAYNPVPVKAARVAWSVKGVMGRFSEAGQFTALNPGTATITARLGRAVAQAQVAVVPDKASPAASPPMVRLVAGSQLNASVLASAYWDEAADIGVGVAGYELRTRTGTTGWSVLASGSSMNRSARHELARGETYRFGDRAIDGVGNVGAYATAGAFRVATISEDASAITFDDRWGCISSPSYDGSAARSTRAPGATASFRFNGSAVAWVAARSPVRGSAMVFVDGGYAGIVDLHSAATRPREMVFTRNWRSPGRHVLTIVAQGTPGHPRVDVDAFVVLTPPASVAARPIARSSGNGAAPAPAAPGAPGRASCVPPPARSCPAVTLHWPDMAAGAPSCARPVTPEPVVPTVAGPLVELPRVGSRAVFRPD